MAMPKQITFDFVVAGGGTAGCVLASRLSQTFPRMKVALIEAGPDAHDRPIVSCPLMCITLHKTDLEWNYITTPQRGLVGRRCYHCSGKLLSGSSAVNYGGWERGDPADFDHWADLVGDARWNYENLLPFFEQVDNLFNIPAKTPDPAMPSEEPELSDLVRKAFLEAGILRGADTDTGYSEDLKPYVQNWHNDVRQAAGQVYDLSKVVVFTNAVVHRVIIDTSVGRPRATGVELIHGLQVLANKEVIVSCGALRTPQVLMLSGIGAAQQLEPHGIAQTLDSPLVGQNLHDHPSIVQYFRLKHPEKGLTMGSEEPGKPTANPTEWVIKVSAATDRLRRALQTDGHDAGSHPHIASRRMHYETVIVYSTLGIPAEIGIHAPKFDGSIIAAGSLCLLPTSRGCVTIASADPAWDPIIDPNYLSTEHDIEVLRTAVRGVMKAMDTPTAKAEIESEVQPLDVPIWTDSTDEEVDGRIKRFTRTWFHPAGTAAMGKVVDAECRVIGADNLRVVDASIIPAPIAASPQATIYAMSELVAHMMASEYGATV